MLQSIFKVIYNYSRYCRICYFEFQQSKYKLPLNVYRLSFPFQMLAVTHNTDFDLILVEGVVAVEVESVQSLSILSRRRWCVSGAPRQQHWADEVEWVNGDPI